MTESTTKKRILIIRNQLQPDDPVAKILDASGFFVYHYSVALEALAQVYNEPPDLILLSTQVSDWESFIRRMKSDLVYGHLPLILLTRKSSLKAQQALTHLPLDDMVLPPVKPEEILLRVQLRLAQANRALDANPLTRLPGNVSIMQTLQKHIDSATPFGLGWGDLDSFKAYNDRYGFARGDELIRMTARIMTNIVRRIEGPGGFVGHVGGDDFVFIVPAEEFLATCNQVIQYFDMTAPTFVNDADRIRGYFESKDRQGNSMRFPLPSISIAGIDSRITHLEHPGEAASIASEVKKQVKKLPGSNVMLNRRTKKTPSKTT